MQGIIGKRVLITGGCGDIGRAVAASLQSLGTTEELADAFVFLASDDGAYITGTTLLVDGGASLVRRDD